VVGCTWTAHRLQKVVSAIDRHVRSKNFARPVAKINDRGAIAIQIDLADRVAIVTGGSKGIGRATAIELAKAGARVAICARGEQALAEAAAALRAACGTAPLTVQADVTIPDDVKRVVATTVAHFGQLDILVNNAVTSSQNTFDALSDEDWRYHIEVKLLGYVRFCREVLPHLKSGRGGRIVNVAGMSARIVTDFRMTNGAVNSAVSNFSKHLSEQLGRHGVTVNAVHPGYTWTPRLAAGLERWAELEKRTVEEQTAKRIAEIPIGRFIQPQDLANLIVFLCSDLAEAVTGQSIAVDGGSGRAISY
jgi:3-oxoacyl-[acyl-carrier protein] reductase